MLEREDLCFVRNFLENFENLRFFKKRNHQTKSFFDAIKYLFMGKSKGTVRSNKALLKEIHGINNIASKSETNK